jgi:predicted  nucleic acid-binding Zn-ribbon protein
MSWFKNLFGDSKGKAQDAASGGGGAARSKSSSPPPPSQDDKYEGIQSMKNIDSQIDIIEKRIAHQELQLREQEEKIKAIMRECGTDEKKKERRKPELMRHVQQVQRMKKHIADDEKKLVNFTTMKDSLVMQVQAVDEVEAMKGVTKSMKKLQHSEKEVDDMKDELDEVMEASQRTNERIAEGFTGGVQVTEDDLDEIMAGLQDEVADEVLFPSCNSTNHIAHYCDRLRNSRRLYQKSSTLKLSFLPLARNNFQSRPPPRLQQPKRRTSSTGAYPPCPSTQLLSSLYFSQDCGGLVKPRALHRACHRPPSHDETCLCCCVRCSAAFFIIISNPDRKLLIVGLHSYSQQREVATLIVYSATCITWAPPYGLRGLISASAALRTATNAHAHATTTNLLEQNAVRALRAKRQWDCRTQ